MGEHVVARARRRMIAAAVVVAAVVIAAIAVGVVRVAGQEGRDTASAALEHAPLAEPAPSAAQEPVAVFIGDSYTYGAGRSSEAASFPAQLGELRGWRVVNIARGGTGYATSAGEDGCGFAYCETYAEVIPEAVAAAPDVVVVSGGRNDLGTEDLEAGVVAFFEELRAALPEARIYVTSPLWGATEPPAELRALARWVEREAEAHDATYLELGDLFLGQPELIQADGVHPNDDGLARLARAIDDALDVALRSAVG
ncbi:SGNH/GDSL hydrolase family protein [Agrococcus sp. SL85]|uniref:SGNH/GDSL hydrolase family protein n=1 Tax=Agrococcus sp. SL85 TaxID=2995141 RepID=UPI00226CC5B6|nr:SGNH/GDSL hydrolase family protein [Agrococcus sp. SL85]WAC66493.1 SGNH/GDSL hydrolase family protein [Agrococcus sp. SL85]